AFSTTGGVLAQHIEVSPKSEQQTVNCLDLNSNENNLICSGSNDGSITIWDLNESLKQSATLSPTIPIPNDEVLSVAWNKQVKSIIASVTNSNVYIYDTRKKEQTTPIMQCLGSWSCVAYISKAVCWSHTHATSLIVASANDANPHLQIWDLRYANCLLRYLKGGHNRGIVTVAWNPFDEQIILSAAKDNTTCLWNPTVGPNDNPLISVIPSVTNQWINDIKWCSWEPSLFAVGSLDG
ncbi:protein transport protein Sec31A-like protein, partial [Leptotrombidium deliense]